LVATAAAKTEIAETVGGNVSLLHNDNNNGNNIIVSNATIIQ
jgi:hypothetical protein